MANTNRRKFIQASAATAASVALNPLSPLAEAGAETAATATSAVDAAGGNDRVGAVPVATQALQAEWERRAVPVPLNRVRLTGGPLKVWQDADAKYLLSLEPDRMMAFYRERAGLTKKAEPYAGWDGAGRNLTGHIAGHHLSAVSLMYLATGDGDAGDTYSIGVMKSTDGGATWNTTGLTWTVNQGRIIRKLLINPTNTQIIMAFSNAGI